MKNNTNTAWIPEMLCHNRDTTSFTSVKRTALRGRRGMMVVELIMAVVVLSFIFRPVIVESCDGEGRRYMTVEWELPMAKMLTQVGKLERLIDKSWEGMDRKFGYKGGNRAKVGRLMQESLQNGVVMMTAGFVDRNGRWTGNFENHAGNWEEASKGMLTAYYNAAREGMR